MSAKKISTISGVISSISPVVTIQRKVKNSFNKRTIGVETSDNQLIFFEMRNNLDMIPTVGTLVTAEYHFAGSIKDDKCFNNIIATKFITNE